MIHRIESSLDDPLALENTGYALFDMHLERRGNLFGDQVYRLSKQAGFDASKTPSTLPAHHKLGNNDIIVGAVGVLQYEVVAFRLKEEYKVEAIYEPVNIYSARWVDFEDAKSESDFVRKAQDGLAEDGAGHMTYLATSRVNLSLTEERFPEVNFRATREH